MTNSACVSLGFVEGLAVASISGRFRVACQIGVNDVRRRRLVKRLIAAAFGRNMTALAADQLTFCELERRRVLSVNASFLNGILSIDIAPGLEPNVDTAALVSADGQTFLVDINGNGTGDAGELTGAIADLERLVVDGQDGYGRFGWYGDFSQAKFDDSTLASINLRGLNNVVLGAEVATPGFVSVRNIHGPVQLGGDANYAGVNYVGSLSVDRSVNIVGNTEVFTGANAEIQIGEDLLIRSSSDVNLATESGDAFRVAGHTQIFAGDAISPKNVQIGELGTATGSGPLIDLNRVSLIAVNATLHDVNDIELDQVTVNQLGVYAGGRVSDRVVAQVNVAFASLFEAGELELATGEFNTGTLEFRIRGSAIVEEASDTHLVGDNRAGNLTLVSNGSIEDQALAKLTVIGPAIFDANDEIRLADSVTNSLTISGHAQFIAGDTTSRSAIFIGLDGTQATATPLVDLSELSMFGSAATIFESNDLVLRQVDLNAFDIFLRGSLSDLSASNIGVSGATVLEAGEVSLGTAAINGTGVFNSGTLEFRATGDVVVSESSTMNLVGDNRAQNVRLRSAGSIEDTAQASLLVSDNLIALASEHIFLANNLNSRLDVTGNASFSAGGEIRIGLSPGVANFGTLSLLGTDVEVQEASSTHLTAGPLDPSASIVADNLTISSIDQITQDAVITVTGNTVFELQQTGDVMLARSTDPGTMTGSGALMNNRFDGAIRVAAGSGELTELQLRDVSSGGARLLGTVPGSSTDSVVIEAQTESLELLLPNRSLEIVAADLQIGDQLQIVVGMDGDGIFPLLATNDRSITDASGAGVTVGGSATLRSSGDVVLADQVADAWQISGDLTVVAGYQTGNGFVGQTVSIGREVTGGLSSGASVDFETINVQAEVLDLAESSRVDLKTIELGSGRIIATGPIYDVAGAKIIVRDDLSLESVGEIVLADLGTSDQLNVGGVLDAVAIANQRADGGLELGVIRVGSGIEGSGINRSIVEADVRLGQVDLLGRDIALFESDGTFLSRVVAAEAIDAMQNVTQGNGLLQIVSGGAIQNQVLDGSLPPGVLIADVANLDASRWMVLEGTQFSELSIDAGENLQAAAAEQTHLRSLRNAEAVTSSEVVFGDIDQAFARNQPEPLSLNPGNPASLSEIGDRFDFEVTHAGQYAVQLRNLGSLELTEGTLVGDGLNIYVETLAGNNSAGNLTISGPIGYASDTAGVFRRAVGGTVLVAGGELVFENGGGLVAEQFEVYDTDLNAFSFHGGEGAGGRFSTARVLPLEAAQLDPSTQHYQQQVASLFGNRSSNGVDLGFQHVVAYADGSYQFFDVRESSVPGRADLLVRERVFDTLFLTSWGGEQLPTSVVFRRAEGLFLYEEGGRSDLAAESFAATASSSFVNDVFIGTADPPLPPIAQPAPPPELPLVSPVLILPEAPRTTIEISSSLEVRSLTENVSEIIIVAIYWEDVDRMPANERLERAEFQQLEVQAASEGAEFLAERKREIVRLAGEQKLPVNATDEQLERLIEDVQRNPLDYVDPQGRPLFTEPVYGIIQSDPERGETLWRMFMIRTDELEVGAEPAEMLEETEQNEKVEAGVQQLEVKVPAETGQVEESSERLDGAGKLLDNENSNSMLLTPAVLAAFKRLSVRFDRESRAQRRKSVDERGAFPAE